MNKKKSFLYYSSLTFFTLTFFFITSCTSNNLDEFNTATTFDKDVQQIVSKMTTREKIGQVLLLNFRYVKKSEAKSNFNLVTDFENSSGKIVKVVPLDEINSTVKTTLENFHIGNIILFAENLIDTEKSLLFIQQMQNIAINNGDLPLIIAVDQEGGRVNRLFSTTIFPSARLIASTKNTDVAFLEGQFLAEQLLALGINLNFAPVCDVNSNPKNQVIGDRSYSSNPKVVAKFATALHLGLQSKNLISAAKHFPGHGDTEVDSHIGLPKISKSKKNWLIIESIPFTQLIKNNVPIVMSAHIQYPALDNSTIIAKKTGKKIIRPATLSKKILTNLLKNELGFTGVICTDALDMKAISKNFTESQAVIEALNAGADLLCNPISIIESSDLIKLDELYNDIEKAIKNKTLSIKRLDDAVCRIIQLKKNYKILQIQKKTISKKDILKTKAILSSKKYKSLLK